MYDDYDVWRRIVDGCMKMVYDADSDDVGDDEGVDDSAEDGDEYSDDGR